MSKFLPWILAASIVGGAIFAYAQTNTNLQNKTEANTYRISVCEKKQENLVNLIQNIDRKITIALTLLGHKNNGE